VGARARIVALVVAGLTLGVASLADDWVVFSKDEVSVIQRYYAEHPVAAAPDGQKGKGGKALPPGIAKNLARGKPLPPGIAKQYLPTDLVRQLPPVRAGYERVYVDGRVLLVDVATQLIHDVLVEAATN
jgi:hypothetical protein